MSFDGHVLCHRMLIAPCAETTLGAATVAALATAAPRKNLRRVVSVDWGFRDMSITLLRACEIVRDLLAWSRLMNHRDRSSIPVWPSLYGLRMSAKEEVPMSEVC